MNRSFEDIFSLERLAIVLVVSSLGFLLALIVRAIQGKPAGEAALNGLEAGSCMLAGMLLAQVTVAAAILMGDYSTSAQVVTSLFFLIWPGLVNLVALPFTDGPLIGTYVLLWIALAVGAGAGFFDGFFRIHKWAGPGIITFLGDFTWGLPLTVNALVIHLINLIMATHQQDGRRGAHRYLGGFRIKGNFAFTQGNLLSNLGDAPPAAGSTGESLYTHEQTHVLQNRVFGPVFWITYFGWLILFGLFGLIGSLVSRGKNSAGVRVAADSPMWWGYFNNPWELWAYTHNPTARSYNLPPGDGTGWLDWPPALKVIFTILGMGLLGLLIGLTVWGVWLS